MDRVVEPRVGAHSAVEAAGAPVDLAEQLNLQPTFAHLDCFHRRGRTAELSDSEQADLPDQLDEALGDADNRADLADPLQLAAEDGGHPGEVGVESDGDLRAKNVPDPADARRFAFRHLASPPWPAVR